MHVIDLEGNEYPLQATTTNDYELSGNQSLSFKIIPSKVNKLFINDITEMWQVIDHDDIAHKIIYFKKKGEGSALSVDVKAIPKVFDDLDSQRIYERYDRHMTANYCFNLIFEGSGYNFILNGTFEAQDWEGFGEGDTRLSMFQNALNRYRAEFRVVGNAIYIENLIGRDTGFMYRYRLNASNIVQENDASAYWTYAKGYGDYGDGAGGEDWQQAKLIQEYTSPIASIIGIREGPPIKNGNIATRDTMDEQLKILVDESLKISVSATIHDLRKQGYAMAQPEMGDRVFLIDERIGLNAEVRVVNMKLVRNWKKEVIGIDLTLGSPGLVKRHQANLQTAISNITNLLEGKIKLPFSVLDNAVAEATKALQNITSELSVPPNGGLMAVDKDNPNNLVLFNAAGIGVSDDGGATFGNALTGLGLNVDYVYAGTMLADRIAGGILSSLNGNTEFNLNSGLLQMENTEFQLGGGANIRFTNRNNRLLYVSNNVHAGIQFDHSLGPTDNPMIGIGISDGTHNVNDPTFRGIRIHSLGVEGQQGYGTNIITQEFTLNNIADMTGTGFRFKMHALTGTGNRSFYPLYAGNRLYDLGTIYNKWNNLFVDDILSSVDLDFRNMNDNQQGFRMELGYGAGPHMAFYGLSASNYYALGKPDRAFSYGYINQLRGVSVGSSPEPYQYIYGEQIIGTVVGTSTKNAKMSIEDVDGKQAFDYFDMMEVKSFFYKDADITNRYNRKVSPIIEQLDPVLENLYKATDEGLDINSNLFLLAQAFKHYSQQTNSRLEMLENGA